MSSFLAGEARSQAYGLPKWVYTVGYLLFLQQQIKASSSSCLNIQMAQTFREAYSSFFFFSYKYSSPRKPWALMDLKFCFVTWGHLRQRHERMSV
jgi:hypothetical protein